MGLCFFLGVLDCWILVKMIKAWVCFFFWIFVFRRIIFWVFVFGSVGGKREMNEQTEKTSSALAIPEKKPHRPGGCVGIFFQLFDWNRRFAKKKLFSRKLLPPAPGNFFFSLLIFVTYQTSHLTVKDWTFFKLHCLFLSPYQSFKKIWRRWKNAQIQASFGIYSDLLFGFFFLESL